MPLSFDPGVFHRNYRLPTYSRPPSNTMDFHQATRFRSTSSRRSAPADSRPAPIHRDGYHPAVSAETTAHYLPKSHCARAPTLSAEPPHIFPTDSRIAAPPSAAIVGLASSTTSPTYPRHRPPHFRTIRIYPLSAFSALPETLAEPSYCRYLRDIVSPLCEHRPSTACLAMTPARVQQPLLPPPT